MYSIKFRTEVLRVKKEQKLSFIAVAKKFGLSKTTVYKWSKNPEFITTRNRKATVIGINELQSDIEKFPDSYYRERATRLGASTEGIRDAMYRLKVTYKKNTSSSQEGRRSKVYVLPEN
jgi:transposase